MNYRKFGETVASFAYVSQGAARIPNAAPRAPAWSGRRVFLAISPAAQQGS
jgi:hypothetical protein